MDVDDLSSERFDAYGPAPYPDARDAELDDYVGGLRIAGAEAIALAMAAVSRDGQDTLCAYAERTADRAVRGKNPDLLINGLIALVVAKITSLDPNVQMSMGPVYDAASRSGGNPKEIVKTAGNIVQGPGQEYLEGWLNGRAASSTLERTGYTIGEDETGFRYRFAPREYGS
jgi:hypothetical protein